MKPSEKIIEIFENRKLDSENEPTTELFNSILVFLDEEYERNKPCEHDLHPHTDCRAIKVCYKCGILQP